MSHNGQPEPAEDQVLNDSIHTQIEHFRNSNPPCRAMHLPEGILLRYNLSQSLFFYLKTLVVDGKITTKIFASDSPYERQKTAIGEVRTPMFDDGADQVHLLKLEDMLRSWVDFVRTDPDLSQDFSAFDMEDKAHRRDL